MRHVLITGGAGFIGLHLARRLVDDGCRVDLFDNFSRGQRDPELEELAGKEGVTLHEGDLNNAGDLASLGTGYSEIFHFAAILGVQNVADRPFDVLEKNNALTLSALDVARRQSKLGRFIFASTSEVYAGTLERFELPIPTPETVALAMPPLERPRTSYALSKIYGEALCLHSGLPVTIVRPHNVYGPRMGLAHVIPQLLDRGRMTEEGGSLEVYSPGHSRTFCYVEDAVEMISRLAIAQEAVGCSVNVGMEKPEITIRSLAEIIIKAQVKNVTIVSGPETPGSPLRRAPEMTLCQRLTGYQAKVPVEEGVIRTMNWYMEHVFDTELAG